MTTILIKKKDTTGAPSSGDLTNAAGGAEIAVNTFDKRLYTKDSGGTVVELGTNPTDITTGTVDTTNLEVTNIKAKDGTAAASIADSTGKITVSTELAVDNLNLSGNAITSTNTNGNIALTPNGLGEVDISKVDIAGGEIDAVTLGTNSPVTEAQIDNINIDGNTISTTDTDGNLILSPDGTGVVQEEVGGTNYNLASQYDIGTAPNEIPLNQYLGSMAYLDADNISFDARGTNTAAQNLAVNKLTTVTISADTTLTTTVPLVGSTAFVIVITSGATSRTVTFGTGFKSTGTLATGTDADRRFVFQFISDGTNLVEVSRTTAITY